MLQFMMGRWCEGIDMSKRNYLMMTMMVFAAFFLYLFEILQCVWCRKECVV